MPRPQGTRFGAFEILGLIGAGGMGEVYRVRDTRLDRDVALKVLPDAFIQDPDRLARFEREAKTLAALNHPHIAHLYGFEDVSSADGSGRTRALVMELVEGEDLAQRIARGPLPAAEVVSLARQIADAVAAAHEKGIIHRDLKPANIKVRSDGTVKVLDFGLAKALGAEAVDDAAAPTITRAATAQGVVLGTAAYMSPEQARGYAVDARTDVWAFGCVLFEMLTGRAAFLGATMSDTIARILEREPDVNALPASTPPSLRRLLTRCLEKDPKRRLHAIADAQFEIDEALVESRSGTGTRAALPPAHSRRWAIAVAGALILAAAVWWVFQQQAATLPPPRVMALTSFPGLEAVPSFSPDGKQAAFSWDGVKQDNDDIYVVIVGSDTPHRVTVDPARDVSPAWKPDGSQIAFARLNAGRAAIYIVSPLGDQQQKLAEFSSAQSDSAPLGTADPRLSWSPDGRWLAVSGVSSDAGHGVFLVAADGSSRHLLLPAKDDRDYTAAAFSPSGGALAYVNAIQGSGTYIELVTISSSDPPAVRDASRRLTPRLGFVNGLAWTVDGKDLLFGAAQDAAKTSFLWRVTASGGAPPERIELAGAGATPTLSASGHRLAYSRRTINNDLLILRAGADPETVLASTFVEQDAAYSPDGSKIAFASDRTGEGMDVWVAATDGSGRRLLSKNAQRPAGTPRWSPDGRRLAFDALGEDGHRHVYVVDEAGGQPEALAYKPGASDRIPSWSRDGKWIYFGSNRSGRFEAWRAPAAGGEAHQVTTNGGDMPVESLDARSLYFARSVEGGWTLFRMPIAGGPEQALHITTVFWNFTPTSDGLYYVPSPPQQKGPRTFEVRFLDFATGRSRLLHPLRVAALGPGLSVSPDGKTVLVSAVAEMTQDLMRIENFR